MSSAKTDGGGDDRATIWAVACAGALIASQVAGKATRDALLLSSLSIKVLPAMLMASSVLSLVAVLVTSRLSLKLGPRVVAVRAMVLSGLLYLVEWGVASRFPQAGAIAVYVHTTVLGTLLISVFWSTVSERFDPRTAKKRFGRIAAGATLGGLLGGLLAERVAAMFSMSTVLPVLAVLQGFGALAVSRLWVGSAVAPRTGSLVSVEKPRSALELFVGASYLRDLGLLVVFGTISAALLDYVFKASAVQTYRSADLLRFFALFYAGTGLATFLLQIVLSSRSVAKLGLAGTVATLPAAVLIGSIAAVAMPGFVSIVAARGGESVLRSSLFRSAYELFYTPVPNVEKRRAKPIIDVGFERLGDAAGGAVAQAFLVVLPAYATPSMMVLAAVLAVGALWIARRLHGGYVEALERSLLTRGIELDVEDAVDPLTRSTILRTASALPRIVSAEKPAAAPPPASDAVLPASDPVASAFAELRSGNIDRVNAVLRSERALELALVPQVVALVAWDEVASGALEALGKLGPRICGQLVDVLLDPDEPFSVRRRIPRVLGACETPRAVAGLATGLSDKRFEVRYQCARAIGRLVARKSSLTPPRDAMIDAVLRELEVGAGVWDSQRLLDRLEDSEGSPFVDEVLKERTHRGLEHVFTLLSLFLPEPPLKVAFRGLHTDDPILRGTALEYLESILPERIREKLVPIVENRGVVRPPSRPREEVLAELMRSQHSIDVRLRELRQKASRDPG